MSDSRGVWYITAVVYINLLLVIVLLLAYQNSMIPSRFKDEGEAAFKALLPAPLVHSSLVIAYETLVLDPTLYLPAYWVTVLTRCAFPVLLLSVIAAPKVNLLEYECRIHCLRIMKYTCIPTLDGLSKAIAKGKPSSGVYLVYTLSIADICNIIQSVFTNRSMLSKCFSLLV